MTSTPRPRHRTSSSTTADPNSDPHQLDADGDGIACESNPCPCSTSQGGGGGGNGDGGGGGHQDPVKRQKARVIRVVDGDTVNVKIIKGRKATVRLIGIDTPEVFGGTECWGPEASATAKRWLPRGTRVRLISDPSQDLKDRYGRILRYVIKGSTDINKRMVRKGHARVYVYNHHPFKRTGNTAPPSARPGTTTSASGGTADQAMMPHSRTSVREWGIMLSWRVRREFSCRLEPCRQGRRRTSVLGRHRVRTPGATGAQVEQDAQQRQEQDHRRPEGLGPPRHLGAAEHLEPDDDHHPDPRAVEREPEDGPEHVAGTEVDLHGRRATLPVERSPVVQGRPPVPGNDPAAHGVAKTTSAADESPGDGADAETEESALWRKTHARPTLDSRR